MSRPELLHQYAISPENEGIFPLNWEEKHFQPGPIKVEVGFGGGEYLAWWAKNEPFCNFVGIELPQEGIAKACREAHLLNCENVRLVRGDARYLLHELFATGTVDKVLMQFPMPWPKEKHAKHRVSSSRFTNTLADILKVGGEFELVTDQEWYAKEAWEHFNCNPSFTLTALEVNPERPFKTRYESKWLKEGRSIFRFVACLQKAQQSERLIRNPQMHHLHIDSPISEDDIKSLLAKKFKGSNWSGEIKEVLLGANCWVLRAVSADDSFSQFFSLRLIPRDGKPWLLKVDEQPRPYPTPAVRNLIDGVGDALRKAKVE